MWENLNLRGISPSHYPTLGDTYSDGNVRLISFLNHVPMERWSCVEADVDGKTRESTGLGPVEFNSKANASTKAAGAIEATTFPQPSSTTLSESTGTTPGETGCSEGTIHVMDTGN